MPIQMRKLSQNEATRVFPRRGQMDVSAYTEALRALQVGDSAELKLAGLSSPAAKRRLGQAAAQVGYRLKWASVATDECLYFQVQAAAGTTGAARVVAGRRRGGGERADAAAQGAASGEASASPPAARRRGRPRKAADA